MGAGLSCQLEEQRFERPRPPLEGANGDPGASERNDIGIKGLGGGHYFETTFGVGRCLDLYTGARGGQLACDAVVARVQLVHGSRRELPQLVYRSRKHDAAAVDHCQLSAELFDLVHVVTAQHHGCTVIRQAPREEAHIACASRVERARWLVEKEQPRTSQQRRRQAETLAHSGRVARDRGVRACRKAHLCKHVVNPFLATRFSGSVEACEQREVPPSGQIRIKGRCLDEAGDSVGQRSACRVHTTSARLVVRTTQGAVLQQAATGADGTFTVAAVPAGSYWLEVSAAQFESRHLRLDLDTEDRTPLRVVLGLAPFQSDVTVTAQRGMIAEIEETAPIISVRNSDDFRDRPLATIGNALDGTAGVMVQQSTYGQSSPFLRGLTGYQVLNLVDGVRFNNSTFRSGPNQSLAFADPSQAQRVEVMLGPASAQFGSDALGGAIQVLTPMSRFSDASRLSSSMAANIFAASADRSSGADASFFLGGQRVSWSAGAARRDLDDLRAGGGRDSHHVLRRLFGLDDQQIEEITGLRQKDTGFTQTSLHTKVAARWAVSRA